MAETRREVFGQGVQEMLESGGFDQSFSCFFNFIDVLVSSEWDGTAEKISDMPQGWLDVDLSAGLRDQHLYPNCEYDYIFFTEH